MRTCGTCTLCCKLLPVVELNKTAGEVCKHQRHFKGCTIYAKRPRSCHIWSCAWLEDTDLDERFKRPDKAHYVIDSCLDYVTVLDNVTQETIKIPSLQIWIDPKYPNAHHDKALRDLLIEHHIIGTVRFNSHDGLNLIPPTLMKNQEWLEVSGEQEAEHTLKELAEFFNGLRDYGKTNF
jgi:hypothetical protein